jgi:hypothetical protein
VESDFQSSESRFRQVSSSQIPATPTKKQDKVKEVSQVAKKKEASHETPHFSINWRKFRGWPPKRPLRQRRGGMLLFPALGGLWDEGRFWPKKRRNFCEILIVNILASEPSIEKILKKFA